MKNTKKKEKGKKALKSAQKNSLKRELDALKKRQIELRAKILVQRSLTNHVEQALETGSAELELSAELVAALTTLGLLASTKEKLEGIVITISTKKK